MEKVSVIIPVFNSEKYISQCLDSICSQTLKDIEIICIDDGSTDSSLEIIKLWKRADIRDNTTTTLRQRCGKKHRFGICKGYISGFCRCG